MVLLHMSVFVNILVSWSKAIRPWKVDTETQDTNEISSFKPLIHMSQVVEMLLPEYSQDKTREHVDTSTREQKWRTEDENTKIHRQGLLPNIIINEKEMIPA